MAAHIRIEFDVVLTLTGPVLTQSSAAPAYGVDAAMVKDSNDNWYLPGTLVKGRLRQAWNQLSNMLDITFTDKNNEYAQPLGFVSGNRENKGDVQPFRGVMQFSDFVTTDGTGNQVLYRIRMDADRGAVDTGAYLVIDAPFAPGEAVTFRGTISLYGEEKNAEMFRKQILAGLKWNLSFGAERSVGFGRLREVTVTRKPLVSTVDVGPTISSDCFTIGIRPEAPFCLGSRQFKENLFDSETIIPGNVIKGALASTWGKLTGAGPNKEITSDFDDTRKELTRNFAGIRITHAFPAVRGGQRPEVFPLSLVKDKNGALTDVAMDKKARPIAGAAPEFSIDWKESADVYKWYGWPHVRKELRVRNAHDPNKRKAADKELFAYESIVPDGLEWLATVDLSRIPAADQAAVKSQLIDLFLHGLHGWSKTKTSAQVAISAATLDTTPAMVKGHDCYIITLQTPALLIEPGLLDETTGKDQLEQVYKDVWSKLSDGTLVLDNYFARQSLAGGYYLHKRFRSNEDYYPWILTDAGSVFVLKPAGTGDAEEKIRQWLAHGLELPGWVDTHYMRDGLKGSHWKNCPFVPENGFGEIHLTKSLHDRRSLKEAKQ